MAFPTNREEFIANCKRRLGDGAVTINVTDEQVEDRVDEALSYYWDYHFDGYEKLYYKHQITQENIDTKSITLPENIIGAVKIFDMTAGSYSGGMFSIQYQIALNDLYTLTSQSMIPYYMAMYQLQSMEQLLVGQKAIRYSRHRNILSIDMTWAGIQVGNYFIVEAYQIIDPDEFPNVWKDRWLLRYASALIQKQWGMNLSKFQGMQLPGGVQFSANRILSDAQNEITQLEQSMLTDYGAPLGFLCG